MKEQNLSAYKFNFKIFKLCTYINKRVDLWPIKIKAQNLRFNFKLLLKGTILYAVEFVNDYNKMCY